MEQLTQYQPPPHWSTNLINKLTGAMVVAGAAVSLTEHDPQYLAIAALAALPVLLYHYKHAPVCKINPTTDVDVIAITGANKILCTPKQGVKTPITVTIYGTRPWEKNAERWKTEAIEELTTQIGKGITELGDIKAQPDGTYTAHITIRSPYPDKNEQYKHRCLARHLLTRGLVTLANTEDLTLASYLTYAAKAQQQGRGAYQLKQ